MTRFITIILLLLVFFFGGMSYGSFERERQTIQPSVVDQEVEKEIEQVNTVIDIETIESEPLTTLEDDYTVHKTASFFEKIVTSLYELVIQIMYSIANLFFD